MKAFITGIGIISPAGTTADAVLDTLSQSLQRTVPLSVFALKTVPLPCGEISTLPEDGSVPRTHLLALTAARQALNGAALKPEALIIGTTTGGMLTTEELLQSETRHPSAYRWHPPGTVGEYVAESLEIHGPVLTISTACAGGATILKLALQMIRSQTAASVLAIGVDSLCRLTYYGFSLLQLISTEAPKPFDQHRKGLNVAEAAAALLIEAFPEAPAMALAELCGGGLSCDAYHVTAPHKDGQGASSAIQKALEDAGLSAREIDYINLHGTGTVENDAAEANAIHRVFGPDPPDLSSTKGIYGHPLAAAGAVEAVIGILSIVHGLVPATVGTTHPDPELGLSPLLSVKRRTVNRILSNSFGFGGNNAAIILGRPEEAHVKDHSRVMPRGFRVLGTACLTGAGQKQETLTALRKGQSCQGLAPEAEIMKNLDSRSTRRLKRLPKLTLSLALAAVKDADEQTPEAIYFGTGLGALSETHAFLERLFKSEEKFSSPTDFIGSLHNSPAGMTAIRLGCQGANITATGTDDSFEEALFCAALTAEGKGPLLCLAAEEAHSFMTPLLDPSTHKDTPSDGGGAFVLSPTTEMKEADLRCLFLGVASQAGKEIEKMIQVLGGAEEICRRFGSLFINIPFAKEKHAQAQLERFIAHTSFSGPVIDYRQVLGQYGAVSATACVLALTAVEADFLPPFLAGAQPVALKGKGILMIGLGAKLSALSIGKWADI